MNLSESKLRDIIREEIERFFADKTVKPATNMKQKEQTSN